MYIVHIFMNYQCASDILYVHETICMNAYTSNMFKNIPI